MVHGRKSHVENAMQTQLSGSPALNMACYEREDVAAAQFMSTADAMGLPPTQPRTVSNPEQTPNMVSISKFLARPLPAQDHALRSVSLPSAAQFGRAAPFPDNMDEAFNSSTRTMVIHNFSSDLPQTPSPPSSPDSVLFVEQSARLPSQFLRGCPEVSKRQLDCGNDGWITCSSPPKPIPALHGPASLPYARCPSGAEGTVIEEQSSLPCIIWGLDSKDTAQPSNAPLDLASQLEALKQSARQTVPTRSKVMRGPRLPRPDATKGHTSSTRSDPSGSTGLFAHQLFSPDFAAVAVDLQNDTYHTPAMPSQTFPDSIKQSGQDRESEKAQVRRHVSTFSSPADLLSLLNGSPASQTPHSRIQFSNKEASVPVGEIRKRAYLPTPPGSSTPFFTTTFSPFSSTRQDLLKRQYEMLRTPITPGTSRPADNGVSSTDELSDQLRRLVMSLQNEQAAIRGTPGQVGRVTSLLPSLPVSPRRPVNIKHVRPGPDPLPAHANRSTFGDAQHAPTALTPTTKVGKHVASSPPIQSYRNNLSNPRSVPIARLRSGTKRGLPPVPEEPETGTASARGRRNSGLLLPLPPTLPQPALLRQPINPPAADLHARGFTSRSVDDFNVEDNAAVRVRLPHGHSLRTQPLAKAPTATLRASFEVESNSCPDQVSFLSLEPLAVGSGAVGGGQSFPTPATRADRGFAAVLTPPDEVASNPLAANV